MSVRTSLLQGGGGWDESWVRGYSQGPMGVPAKSLVSASNLPSPDFNLLLFYLGDFDTELNHQDQSPKSIPMWALRILDVCWVSLFGFFLSHPYGFMFSFLHLITGTSALDRFPSFPLSFPLFRCYLWKIGSLSFYFTHHLFL